MLLLALVFGVVLLACWDLFKRLDTQIPGPFPLPFVGNALTIIKHRHDILDLQLQWEKKYNGLYTVTTFGVHPFSPPNRYVTTTDPDCIKHFLHTNFDNYIRKSFTQRFERLFGKGIFTANGERWKAHRRTARPMFTKHSLEDMQPKFVSNACTVLDILTQAARTGEALDVQELFFRYTLDSIGEIGFGHQIGSLKRPVPFSEAFNRTQRTVSLNGRNPISKNLPDPQFDKDVALMEAFVLDIVRKRREQDDFKERKDLLSRFMCLTDEETGQPFSDEYLKDVVLNFFIAGRDTTACLLTWTFYMLHQNPKVEQKLLTEIDEMLKGEDPTPSKLKEMRYLHNTLDETLRLYPSVPFDSRVALKDDVLPNGLQLKGGSMMSYSAYTMGRSERVWGKDAKEFQPERFEGQYPRDAFVSFHVGPQTCLGRSMAYLEAKTMASMILQRFHLQLVPDHPVVPYSSIVLPSRHGMKMTVCPRTDSPSCC